MAGFSIDDVKTSFAADVSSFIDQLEAASNALRAIRLPENFSQEWGKVFGTLTHAGHAIAGTSGLVGVRSLTETATTIERLAETSEKDLQQVEVAAANARRIAALCAEGAQSMRLMLALELDKKSSQAALLATQWLGKVHEAEHAAPPTAAPTGELSFDDVPLPGPTGTTGRGAELSFGDEPASAAAAGPAIELEGVFQEEARELLVGLQGFVHALVRSPHELGVVASVERLFHTLKGAAATVGLEAISRSAAALQHRVEEQLDSGSPLSREFLERLVQDTNAAFGSANLPELVMPGIDEPPEVREAFLTEVRDTCKQALLALVHLSDPAEQRRREAMTLLADLFHRLKGSALIHGAGHVADTAAHLQALCKGETRELPSAAAISAGVRRIGTALGLTIDPAALAAAESVESFETPLGFEPAGGGETTLSRQAVELIAEPEVWEGFQLECADLLESIDRNISLLEESAQPKQVLAELMRLIHTLKGSVSTVGLAPTGAVLHRVEDFLEGLLEAPILPSLRRVGSLLLRVQQEVRNHLKSAASGWVESSIAAIDAEITSVVSGRPTTAPATTAVSAATGSAGTAEQRSNDEASQDNLGSRYIRIAAQRLDALMNLAGELVVSRSRLMSRVTSLRSLRRELTRGRRRLLTTVDTFRERYEFRNLDGRTAAPQSSGPRQEVDAAWGNFSDLELDRYEDIHILTRSLAEITNDLNEAHGQLFTELSSFADDSDAFSSLVSGVQTEVTRARMVPLASLFTRLRLAIRDAAERDNKAVRVVTAGENVNVDKTIVDALYTPLLHIVRNAVTHGIEDPQARRQIGKSETGTIHLVARQEAGQIIIDVVDDGAGLDLESLHRRGVALGLLTPDTPAHDPRVAELVFASGVSTRGEVDSVSGRGVGGNIVRRSVERLNGDVQVFASSPLGTTLRITLPLTLVITRALLVRNGAQHYFVPLYFAERIVEAQEAKVIDSAGVQRILIDDDYVLLRSFGAVMDGGESGTDTGPVLILRVGDSRIAVRVSAVLGQEEIVVKALGELLLGHPLFSGVTVRGSGDLALIVDVPGIIERDSRNTTATQPSLSGRSPSNRATTPQAPRSRARVLFIDDSLSVRKVAEKFLTSLGCEVTLAVDGVDGLARLRRDKFDLVLTDLEMPRMHGYELIRELRFVPAYQSLPIVVVTSRSGQRHRDQAKSLGASDYITKPFTQAVFAELLDRWCPRSTAAAGAGAAEASEAR